MRILYLTKELPFGATEAFILPELASHRRAGWDVHLAPVSRSRLVHAEAAQWLPTTLDQPLISLRILAAAVAELLRRPVQSAKILIALASVSNWRLRVRNLAVWPKGVWLGRMARHLQIEHIHAHWIAAPATMGIIAARVSGAPFSITAHRYDIAQNNLLKEKLAAAVFVRAIDEAGAAELLDQIGSSAKGPTVLHMGVALPEKLAPVREGPLASLRVLIGARLTGKKGFVPLLNALALAKERGLRVELTVYGDGPQQAELLHLAQSLGVATQVRWMGVASHETLLRAIASGEHDAGVLPSVTAPDGDKEGIPVFLMECMAAGLPVVTTNNGGIGELVGGQAGLVCDEGSADQLAAAFLRVARDPRLRLELSKLGRQRISDDFEIECCTLRMRQLIAGRKNTK